MAGRIVDAACLALIGLLVVVHRERLGDRTWRLTWFERVVLGDELWHEMLPMRATAWRGFWLVLGSGVEVFALVELARAMAGRAGWWSL